MESVLIHLRNAQDRLVQVTEGNKIRQFMERHASVGIHRVLKVTAELHKIIQIRVLLETIAVIQIQNQQKIFGAILQEVRDGNFVLL